MPNPDTTYRIMVAAVEPSGDALGAELLHRLNEVSNYNFEFFGCGGELMEAAGFQSAFPIKPLSVMGFLDVARAIPQARRRVRELAHTCNTEQVDAVIFIDGWAFSRIGAEQIRKISPQTKMFKYVAPQIWASRPQRLKFVKEYFDGVLTVLPFETSLFQNEGIPTQYVGNAAFQHAKQSTSETESKAFRAKYAPNNAPLLAILPGSRPTEISRLAPEFIKTLELLRVRIPNLEFIIPMAPSVEEEVRQAFSSIQNIHFVSSEEKYLAFSAADAALVTSGTVSTEVAIHRTPQVIAYKFDPVTAIWAKTVLTIKYASILSIMAGEELIPEFLQEECKPAAMADTLYNLLTDPNVRNAQLKGLEPVLDQLKLDARPASHVAADTILGWLNPDN